MKRLCSAMLMLMVVVPAWAGADAVRQAKLEHMVRQDCGSCHGMTLKGGLGSPLLPEALASKDDAVLVKIVLDGLPGTAMPPWRGQLSREDAQWIIKYLKRELPHD